MEMDAAIERVLLGEPLRMISAAYREDLLHSVGLDPEEAEATTFRKETGNFLAKLCRELGRRHSGDFRAMVALRDWIEFADEYEAYDALLTAFDPEDRDVVIERGRLLFTAAMTRHWDS